jgi:hypothetical protein
MATQTDEWGAVIAFGTWAQAAFLAFAFLFAWRQVHLYKKAERAKATLDYLRDWDRLYAESFRNVHIKQDTPQSLRRLEASLSLKDDAAEASLRTLYDVFNYFDEARSLLKLQILYESLFLDQMDELVLLAYAHIEIAIKHGLKCPMAEFRVLARQAQDYYLASSEASDTYLRGLQILDK